MHIEKTAPCLDMASGAALPLPAMPLVSILLPAYNAERFLARAVASVREQTLTRWELLIVDDGSTDGTARLMADLAATDGRIRALTAGRNTGAAAARNLALAAAQGRFIAFLDADDTWLPGKLEAQVQHLTETGAAFGYCGFWRSAGGRSRQVHVPISVTRKQLLRGNVIGCLTAIYDSAALGRVPMPNYTLSHDYALWIDLLGRGGPGVGLDRPLAINHREAGSLTASRWRSACGTWEVLRRHAGLSRARAVWSLGNHLLRRALRG